MGSRVVIFDLLYILTFDKKKKKISAKSNSYRRKQGFGHYTC
jgi:hypothetical protein